MFSWKSGDSLNDTSYIAQYFNDSVTVAGIEDSGLLVPYTTSEYTSDPLRRPRVFSNAGAYRDHPITRIYLNTDDEIAGYSSSAFEADSVFDEMLIDENRHMTHVYKDKLGRTIGSLQSSLQWSESDTTFECTAKDTSVAIHCWGYTGIYYQRTSFVIPMHAYPSPQIAQAVSEFSSYVTSEQCDSAMYTSVYRNGTLVAHRTGADYNLCVLSEWSRSDTCTVRGGDVITLVAEYPSSFEAWGGVDLTFNYDVCDRVGGDSTPIDTGVIATTFYKDFGGNDTLIVQPEGQYIRRQYNNHGWLLKDSSGDYGEDTYMYDQRGNERFKCIASDNGYDPRVFHYTKYDEHRRPIEKGVIIADSLSRWAKIHASNADYPSPATIDTSKYRVMARFSYDQGEFGRGRLTKATSYASGHSDSASWEEYSYDAYGHVTMKKQHVFIMDTALTTRDMALSYNNIGQAISMSYPNGKYIDYTYDRAGRVTKVLDNSGVLKAEFEYWPTGQVKTKKLGLGPAQTVDYKYNARDWLVSINDGQADTSVAGSGDHMGLQLTYESGGYGGYLEPLPTEYYNGNVASYTTRVSDATVSGKVRSTVQSFGYDPLDRLAGEYFRGNTTPSAGDTLRTYHYDRNGNLKSVHRRLNMIELYNYDAGTNRLESKIDGSILEIFRYTLSGSITDYVNEGIKLKYNYDEQLSMRAMAGAAYRDSVRYWYNTSGQRIAKKFDYADLIYCWAEGDSTGVEPDADPNMLMMGPGGLEEDTTGTIDYSETVSDSSLVLGEESSLGGMMAMSGVDPGGGTGYWYPCPEQGSVTTGYYYLGNDLLSDYHRYGSDTMRLIGNYVYVNGERIAKFEGDDVSRIEYYLSDHLGSVLATVGYNGNVLSRNLYRPWGEMLNSSVYGNHSNNFRYTGQYLDEDLSRDLAYYGQRYYDSKLRIFTSPDALWYKSPGTGSYVYCRNNPVKYVDPDGQDIAFYVDKTKASENGHTTLYYQNREGDWFSYSQGANGATSSGKNNIAYALGLDAPAYVSINRVDGPPEGSVVITTSEAQDVVIERSALGSQRSHNSGETKYNLYTNNCTDAAVDVVNKSAADLKIPNPALTIKPNSWFKLLQDWVAKQQEDKKKQQQDQQQEEDNKKQQQEQQ
jgi:RHS repeat-associated protein